MSIKTNELQQLQSILGTDSLLADTAAAGTGRLSLAQAAAFFGGELIKTGNPVGAALSNKADILKVTRDLYVSNSGSDTTGDGTEAKPFATIQKAVDSLPKNLNGHRNTIHVAVGTYAGFHVFCFYGGAYRNRNGIEILGDENGGTMITGAVVVASCEAPVGLYYLNVTGMEAGHNISVLSCGGSINLHTCKCTGTTAENGMWIQTTRATLFNCEVSDKTGAAIEIDGSVVFASHISGSGNAVCFRVGHSSSGKAGLLIGDLHNIAGTTKYLRDRGGIVFANGALV